MHVVDRIITDCAFITNIAKKLMPDPRKKSHFFNDCLQQLTYHSNWETSRISWLDRKGRVKYHRNLPYSSFLPVVNFKALFLFHVIQSIKLLNDFLPYERCYKINLTKRFNFVSSFFCSALGHSILLCLIPHQVMSKPIRTFPPLIWPYSVGFVTVHLCKIHPWGCLQN